MLSFHLPSPPSFLLLSAVNRGLKFYQFLESTFGLPLLSQGCGVLDVAGGQGIVSWELSKRDLPTVVVDPRPISGAWTQRRARYLNIRKKIAEELGSRPEVRRTKERDMQGSDACWMRGRRLTN